MNREELIKEIEAKLRGLRSCDTQATAIAWMAGAYKLMEETIKHFEDDAKHAPLPSLIVVPERPVLYVVQTMNAAKLPKSELNALANRAEELRERSLSQTVVYPQSFLHPGLKPAPRAWTHNDTLRLEAASNSHKATNRSFQRKGK